MEVGAREIVVGGSGAGIDGRDIVSVVGGVVKSCEIELAPLTQVRVDEDHVGSVFWFDLELETGTPAAAPGVVGNVDVVAVVVATTDVSRLLVGGVDVD